MERFFVTIKEINQKSVINLGKSKCIENPFENRFLDNLSAKVIITIHFEPMWLVHSFDFASSLRRD